MSCQTTVPLPLAPKTAACILSALPLRPATGYQVPMSGISGIARVSPAEIRVAAQGRARLRVEGRGIGALRVGNERRWVWGAFDETFFVALHEHGSRIAVTLRGIGGWDRHEVALTQCADIASPPITTDYPLLRVRLRLPRSRRIATTRILAPRLRSLVRASQVRAPQNHLSPESDSNV